LRWPTRTHAGFARMTPLYQAPGDKLCNFFYPSMVGTLLPNIAVPDKISS